MPTTRINLGLKRSASHTIEGIEVHIEKIKVPVRFGTVEPSVIADCFLDTGAALTVIPPRVWHRFQPDIRFLDAQAESALPRWLKRFGGAAGGEVLCKIGFVLIRIYDVAYRDFIETEILAMFTDNDANLDVPLLGIGGGALRDCAFHLDYDRQDIWLEKRSGNP
jgi:hypothetical protein